MSLSITLIYYLKAILQPSYLIVGDFYSLNLFDYIWYILILLGIGLSLYYSGVFNKKKSDSDSETINTINN